jgi:hypothetical protein
VSGESVPAFTSIAAVNILGSDGSVYLYAMTLGSGLCVGELTTSGILYRNLLDGTSVPGYLPTVGSGDNGKILMASGGQIKLVAVEFETTQILEQPQSVTIANGATAQFNVLAVGRGLTYQWYYSTTQGETWSVSSIDGNTTDTLSVQAKASRNGQMYRCVVTDANSETVTSEAATLTVEGA